MSDRRAQELCPACGTVCKESTKSAVRIDLYRTKHVPKEHLHMWAEEFVHVLPGEASPQVLRFERWGTLPVYEWILSEHLRFETADFFLKDRAMQGLLAQVEDPEMLTACTTVLSMGGQPCSLLDHMGYYCPHAEIGQGKPRKL